MNKILEYLQQQLRQERNYVEEWKAKEDLANRWWLAHSAQVKDLEEALRKLGGEIPK